MIPAGAGFKTTNTVIAMPRNGRGNPSSSIIRRQKDGLPRLLRRLAMTALFFAAFAVLLALPAHAAEWTVQPAQSKIGFSGTQTGAPFAGSFGKWTGQISYDPANPEAAHVKITIDTASAVTGDTQRDGALPDGDWFDVSAFPQAVFEANGFTPEGENKFVAAGTLTIRGISQKLALPFTLTMTGKQATATGHVTLLRTDYGVGQGVWNTGDYVGLNVDVNFTLVAVQNGG